MTASGRKLNVEAPLAAKACLVGVSPTGTQMRIAGSCGLCCSEGIARPSLVTSRQAYRTEDNRPTVRLTVRPVLPCLSPPKTGASLMAACGSTTDENANFFWAAADVPTSRDLAILRPATLPK